VYRLTKSDWVMEECFGSAPGAEPERASGLPVPKTDSDMIRDALAAEPAHVNA